MSIFREIIHTILQQENLKLLNSKPLHGGDINDTYLIETDKGVFALKINHANRFPNMFKGEAKGLQLLAATASFRIPKVIGVGEVTPYCYLLLEYIDAAPKASDFWESFGVQLAQLHKTTNPFFGLDSDNYIGSLPQYNSCKITGASQFYIEKRLKPQFKLATENGFSFRELSAFYKNITREIPNEVPALIHGDLWSGNYLVDDTGNACLIDPAVAFAPREMDLAMMRLFGGFPDSVFTTYTTAFPLEKGWKNRVELWQLYYLLVHLNLFGNGYYNSVNTIVKKYS